MNVIQEAIDGAAEKATEQATEQEYRRCLEVVEKEVARLHPPGLRIGLKILSALHNSRPGATEGEPPSRRRV